MGIRDADEGAPRRTWLATDAGAGDNKREVFVDPGLEYPGGATRAQLVHGRRLVPGVTDGPAGGDWLHLPDKFFEWRTAENARRSRPTRVRLR